MPLSVLSVESSVQPIRSFPKMAGGGSLRPASVNHGSTIVSPSRGDQVAFGGWFPWGRKSETNPDKVLAQVQDPSLTLVDLFQHLNQKHGFLKITAYPRRLWDRARFMMTLGQGFLYLPWSSKKRIILYPFTPTFWRDDLPQGPSQVARRLISYAGPPMIKAFQRVANVLMRYDNDAQNALKPLMETTGGRLVNESWFQQIFNFTGQQGQRLTGWLAKTMTPLLDQVPPLPFSALSPDVEGLIKAYNKHHPNDSLSLNQVKRTPIGSGSIAQIYEATTARGHKKALKVLRPDVNMDYVNDYMKTIYYFMMVFLGVFNRDVAALVAKQSANSLAMEIDAGFEQEAAGQIQRGLKDIGNQTLKVPKIAVATKRGMVMDFVDGTPLHRLPQAIQERALWDHGRDLLRLTAVADTKHNDLHPGNLLVDNSVLKGPLPNTPVPTHVIDFGRVVMLHPTTNQNLLKLYRLLAEIAPTTGVLLKETPQLHPQSREVPTLENIDRVVCLLKPLIVRPEQYAQAQLRQMAQCVIQAHMGMWNYQALADIAKSYLNGAFAEKIPGFGVLLDLYNSHALMKKDGVPTPVWLLYGKNLSQPDIAQANSKLVNTLQLSGLPPYDPTLVAQTYQDPEAVLGGLEQQLLESALGKKRLKALKQVVNPNQLQFDNQDPLQLALQTEWVIRNEAKTFPTSTEEQALIVKHFKENRAQQCAYLKESGRNKEGRFQGGLLSLLQLAHIDAEVQRQSRQLTQDILTKSGPIPPATLSENQKLKGDASLYQVIYKDLLQLMYPEWRITRLCPKQGR